MRLFTDADAEKVAFMTAVLQGRLIDALDDLEIRCESYDINKLLSAVQVRNMLIRNEYIERRECGDKAEMLYCELAARYGLKYTTIDEVCHGRR